ncbi:type II toxin-antitoxin system HipA family toxin [bacterium]|nr:type II toxin-antitoxin system HipA family toxin [bacterium]
MTKTLLVYMDRLSIGRIEIGENQRMKFIYDTSFLNRDDARPLSLSLPLQKEPFATEKVAPFFANLLPEGSIRDLICKVEGVSPRNDMALLEIIGGDCAGAVSIFPSDKKQKEDESIIKKITDQNLDNMIAKKEQRPLLRIDADIRLSLAGAQSKIPLYRHKDTFYLPSTIQPSSHILKPDNNLFPNMVLNEYFCMKVAKEIGLNIPTIKLYNTELNLLYMIERYDRATENGLLKRIHQEDFCQALSYMPTQKYESEGGPGFQEIFELISHTFTNPAQDKLALLKWLVFNYLIGNADAHAKNISIIYRDGTISLAPFYDILSTLFYPELSTKMAMKYGGENRIDRIQWRHFKRLSEQIEIKPSLMLKIAQEIATKTVAASKKIANETSTRQEMKSVVEKIHHIIITHAEVIRKFTN